MLLDESKKHLSEQEFFALSQMYKIVVEGKTPEQKNGRQFWSLSDLMLGFNDLGEIYNLFASSQHSIECEIEFLESSLFEDELKKIIDKLKKKDTEDFIVKIIDNILHHKKISFHSLGQLSWEYYRIYDYAVLKPLSETPDTTKKILTSRLKNYIQNYLNDELELVNKNYFRFETQKRILLQLVKEDKKIALYGNNFIINEEVDNKGELIRQKDFCLIQTLYAMEKLGYLTVLNKWPVQLHDFEGRKPTRYFVNVNVAIKEELLQEINSDYKKENPQQLFESFDRKMGVLKFAGEEIRLSKSGKETDAVLLMDQLVNIEDDSWLFHDEILESWGYNSDDRKNTPKNKVYFAGQKINGTVAIKTKIEDFIECNTHKARINPKYRKVDK